MSLSIKIGSRPSPLAKIQVHEVLTSIKKLNFEYEIIRFSTQGDLDKTTYLTTNPADNFFTNTLDEAILNRDIDIAIHSAKDLPQHLTPGLKVFALTKTLDNTDSWVSHYSLENLPQGAKVGSSSILRQQMIKSLRPDVEIVEIRGTIQERLELLEQKKIDGLIVATSALKRLGLEKSIKSILPWEATALQGQLAIVGRQGDWEVERLFKEIDVRNSYGHVYLVGAGPGDPELITLKAIEVLKQADCVFYDYLVDPYLLKYAQKAEHIYVGKRKGYHTLSQEKLSVLLREKAMSGKMVVRLKGGDPLIFGRGADEITYLRAYHIEVHVVPGVSSATSIPSTLGVPLTARGVSSSVAFVSGYGEAESNHNQTEIKIPQADTLVFLMGLTKLNQIIQALYKAGWSKKKPIMIISNGTRINQKIVSGTLENIEKIAFESSLEAPALIIAGDTIQFYHPESQKILLHCGTHPEQYTHLGQIISWPMIQIEPISLDIQSQQELIKDFDQSDFVILTSPAAVEHFTRIILGLKPTNAVRQKVYAAIGRATAGVLDDFGLGAQIISSQETAEGLFNLIKKVINLKNKTILFPRSSLPNPFLKKALEEEGAIVKEWKIYENIKKSKGPLPKVPIEGVIFTSPSTFHNFIEDYGTIPASWQILVKGPVTAKALQEAGYSTHVIHL